MLVVPSCYRNGVMEDRLAPGDLLALGESLKAGALTTVGAGTWLGAAIATGIINRTGPTAGYTDTTDTATNILNALSGNAPGAEGRQGQTFRMRLINTVAFLNTVAAGAGVILGSGSTLNVAASTWRDYIWTLLNASPPVLLQANTTNTSAIVTFVLPAGMVALPIGPTPLADNITTGMSVTGTGVPANTTVIGVTQGQGGIVGVTLSANATATSAAGGTPLSFGPTLQLDSIGSGTL